MTFCDIAQITTFTPQKSLPISTKKFRIWQRRKKEGRTTLKNCRVYQKRHPLSYLPQNKLNAINWNENHSTFIWKRWEETYSKKERIERAILLFSGLLSRGGKCHTDEYLSGGFENCSASYCLAANSVSLGNESRNENLLNSDPLNLRRLIVGYSLRFNT